MNAHDNVPDPAAFPQTLEEAYQRYRAELRSFFALRTAQRERVDDLVQTVCIQVLELKARSDFEPRDPQRYLFRMAVNVLNSAKRRLYRERDRLVPCHADEFDAHAQRSNLLWEEDNSSAAVVREQLEVALLKLPRPHQVTALRHFRDGRTYREIAVELNLTEHAVKKRIAKAIAVLRKQLLAGDTAR